ncbi:uncharacterized protein LOC120851165 [Ixodes scapularis]|uniref:uncharacterized protein LOC120851165 n=1 Tax=Ixodes scapularis TaxID=6945 RepID=UPI001A9CDE8A|nr:uncharacterized protein LOC120851165 [Ixodes scapularis]
MVFALATRADVLRGARACNSASCRQIATLIKSSVDASQDPCTNFYQFVCGNWKMSHERSVYAEHAMNFAADVATSLRAPSDDGDRSLGNAVARLYQSCEGVMATDGDDLDNLRDILKDNDIMWPTLSDSADVLATLVTIKRLFNVASLLRISTHESSRRLLVVSPGNVLRRLQATRTGLSWTRYNRFYKSVQEAIASPNSNQSSMLSFERFVVVEHKVIQWLSKKSDGNVIGDLGELEKCTNINRKRWIALFPPGWNGSAEKGAHLRAVDTGYLIAFGNLIADLGEKVVESYVSWSAIYVIAPMMSKRLADLWYRNETLLKEATPIKCLRFVEMTFGRTVFNRYNAKKFDVVVKGNIKEVTSNIVNAFLQKVNDSAWLAKLTPTITSALDVQKMFEQIEMFWANRNLQGVLADGDMGPSFARNWVRAVSYGRAAIADIGHSPSSYSLSRMVSVSSFGFFDVKSRSVRIAPYSGFLPVYDLEVIDAVKYGALGELLAVAAFNVLLNHVPPNTPISQRVETSLQCFAGPEGVYSRRHDFGILLRVVWEAFEALPPEQRALWLDDMPKYTEEQIFFIMACYLTCWGGTGDDDLLETICNRGVRQTSRFSTAFSCPYGGTMNPQNRCTFF